MFLIQIVLPDFPCSAVRDELLLGIPHFAWWVGIAAVICIVLASYFLPLHTLLNYEAAKSSNVDAAKLSWSTRTRCIVLQFGLSNNKVQFSSVQFCAVLFFSFGCQTTKFSSVHLCIAGLVYMYLPCCFFSLSFLPCIRRSCASVWWRRCPS